MNMSGNVGGINKFSNGSNNNITRRMKKFPRVESIQENNQIPSTFVHHISDLMEQSLKQTDYYRLKIKNSFIENLSNKTSNQLNEIKSNHLLKFPERPIIPIELIGKSNEKHLINFIPNSNLNKSDETNTLVGRYEITNAMNPINDYFHYHEQINQFNENISLEHWEEYSKYLNRLLNEYFTEQYFDTKINSLALAEQIKDFFKQIYQRYRIILQVFIEQHLDQSIFIASKSLWNRNTDQFFQYTFSKKNLFIIIISFFIYKE